jgi:hypothetical protein
MLNFKKEIEHLNFDTITIEEVSLKIKRMNKLIFNYKISIIIIMLYILIKIGLIYFDVISFRIFPILLIDLALFEFFRLWFAMKDLKLIYLFFKVTYDIKFKESQETA